jgi:hypothetical protein
MKRFTFVALLAAAMLVCATWIASAGGANTTAHFTLYPPTGGPFPQAKGVITATHWRGALPSQYWFVDKLSVSGLAPNATYYVYDPYDPQGQSYWYSFETDRKRNFTGAYYEVVPQWFIFEVCDAPSDGHVVLGGGGSA